MRRHLLLLPLLVASFAAPSVALAGPAAPTTASSGQRATNGKVRITLLVVHATDSYDGVDPKLASLASSFRYFKYKGYKELSTANADVSPSGDTTFDIVGDRKVKVTLLSKEDADVRVRVEVTAQSGKLLDTTVKINRGGTFIVAGPKYQDGMLILPLRASY